MAVCSNGSRWLRSVAVVVCLAIAARGEAGPNLPGSNAQALRKIDIDLLDDISRRAFRYFWEQSSPKTGLTLDRAAMNPSDAEDLRKNVQVASIAATGFGLAAVCIAQDHRWIGHQAATERVLTTLRFLAHQAPEKNGWFYHFMDADTGERAWQSEVSSIDTALLLAGVLTVRQCMLDEPEVVNLANTIYARVDFPWMMDGSRTYFSHGWKPEQEFLPYRWDTYSELLILYVLGIGSPTHPIPVDTWGTWKLPVVGTDGNKYIGGGPLFIHQYSQAWLDLRDRSNGTASAGDSPANPRQISSDTANSRHAIDYYANSVIATRAQRDFFMNLSAQYKGYSADVWGITASDSTHGYTDWGGDHPRIDGTVAPALPRLADVHSRYLHPCHAHHAIKVWKKHLRTLWLCRRI